jgi:hypothetical protein
MLEWKRRFALATWFGLLAFLGCSGGGSNQPTPSKASDTFSPASIAARAPAENLVCSADNWCWRNQLPQGGSAWTRVSIGTTNGLSGVSGTVESDVWAVGVSGTILHWDGSAWSSVSSGTTNSLRGVWGSWETDVWAVGDGGTILHWDGTAWTSVSSGTTDNLAGIWGSGESDVWAVGSGGTILHWDGSAWMRVSSGTTNGLSGVWGTVESDVWAVGVSGTILHWDGSAWSSVSSGTASNFSGIWESGVSDVWAVGSGGIILHWDGSAWRRVSSGTASNLFGVWGSGESDVWAVGSGGIVLHWDGSAWTRVSSSTGNNLYGVWGSGASDVWAVGSAGTILERHVPSTEGSLQGTVTDTTGLPVSGAQVQAVGPVTRSTTTRGDGTYRLTPAVPEGSYDITVTHPDHNPGSASGVMVVEGQTTIQDFLLTGAGILAGTITDSQGTPLAGVRVQLVGPVTRTINTGSDGSYLFRPPVGTYDITVTLYAYDPGTATDDVADGIATTQNFTLNLLPAHSVSGTVSNLLTGLPFAGATVRILNTPIPPTTTDANGMYLFAFVAEGTYDIQASARGFMTQTQTGVVVNQDDVVDFGLDSVALCDHVPGNLVANCGFESGDFQAWVATGFSFALSVSQGNPHTGAWALSYDGDWDNYIEQQLATTPGATYQLCYWLAGGGGDFAVFWDGVLIRGGLDSPGFGYTQTCHHVVATRGSTALKFGFDLGANWLDDVSVVAE